MPEAAIGFGLGVAVTAAVCWRLCKKKNMEEGIPPTPLGKVEISKDDLARLASEPLFIDFLLLGRISNCLRFAQSAPLEIQDEGTPRASRQMNNAFLIQVAFAVEALDCLKAMGQALKTRAVWKERIVPLFRDPEIQKLESDTVRDLRNRVAFHFDRDAIDEGLAQAPENSTTLLAMRGRRRADVHFVLSDEAAIAFLISMKDLGAEEGAKRFLTWGQRVSQLSLDIAEAVEHVAVDIGKELGFAGVWVD